LRSLDRAIDRVGVVHVPKVGVWGKGNVSGDAGGRMYWEHVGYHLGACKAKRVSVDCGLGDGTRIWGLLQFHAVSMRRISGPFYLAFRAWNSELISLLKRRKAIRFLPLVEHIYFLYGLSLWSRTHIYLSPEGMGVISNILPKEKED